MLKSEATSSPHHLDVTLAFTFRAHSDKHLYRGLQLLLKRDLTQIRATIPRKIKWAGLSQAQKTDMNQIEEVTTAKALTAPKFACRTVTLRTESDR